MYNLLGWKYRILRWNIEKAYRQQIKKILLKTFESILFFIETMLACLFNQPLKNNLKYFSLKIDIKQ